jgi:PAS domain S-box-containing protein
MDNLTNNMNYKKADGRWVDFDVNIQKAFDLVPAMMCILYDDAQCMYLNRAWSAYTGESNESGLGRGWLNTIHPDDILHCVDLFNSSIKNGQPLSMECRIRDKSGQYRWHLNTVKPFSDGSNGVERYICSSVDIHTRKESEESMRINANYYKVYAEAMPAMAFIADATGNIIYYNKRWYEYIGVKEGTKGWGWKNKSIHHPDDLQKTIEVWKHSLNTGEPYEIEYRLRRYDGEYLWHIGKALPMRDGHGNIEMWLGTNTEIHSLKHAEESLKKELFERKAIETQLHKERELFQKIFDTIPVMLSIYDPDLQVTYLNNAIDKITGWTKDDYSKKGIMELVYPDPEYRKWVGEYMDSLLPGFKDIKMMTKSGRSIETSWANIRISDGRNVGIGIDISEQKAFEEKLSKLSNQLHTVVENITDGVIVYDKNGGIIRINKAAISILSYLTNNQNSNPGLDDFLLFDIDGNLILRENWPLFRVLRGEFFNKQEYLTIHQLSGKEAFVEYSGIPIIENNELVMGIITINDVSQKKKVHLDLIESNCNLMNKNEQLEKINQLHENLLYIIAHDLRNPIGNMYLIINLLKEGHKDEEKNSLLGLLNDLVRRQENIVLGLVELLQVQWAEKIKADQIILEKCVRNIIKENEVVLSDCGAEVKLDFTNAPILSYIPGFVESILRNLINNSIKYRKLDRKLHLKITSRKESDFVVMAIEDNGIGIDLEQYKNHLFEPFKRFTKQSEGTGMGLYLIRSLIEKNGGRIEVESSLNEGTTIKCFFKAY